jgi:hypothetical protein
MQELIEGIGARSDVVIKIFGDDLDTRPLINGRRSAAPHLPAGAIFVTMMVFPS